MRSGQFIGLNSKNENHEGCVTKIISPMLNISSHVFLVVKILSALRAVLKAEGDSQKHILHIVTH